MNILPVKKRTLRDDVRERLRQLIAETTSEGLQKLPSEEELARRLCISRVTIRRALGDLEQEGLILRIHGRGTLINPAASNVKVNLALMMEFGTVIERNGYHSEYRLTHLCHEDAGPLIAEQLQIQKGSRLVRVEKLHYADGQPVIASIGRTSVDIFQTEPAEADWSNHPNFVVLEQYAGSLVQRDWVEFQSVTRKQAEEILGHEVAIEAESFLMMRAVAYDQNNFPVMHGIAFYDTNRIQVSLLRCSEG